MIEFQDIRMDALRGDHLAHIARAFDQSLEIRLSVELFHFHRALSTIVRVILRDGADDPPHDIRI